MRSYVDARIATYRKLPDLKASQAEYSRSLQLQNEIWTQAIAAVRSTEGRDVTEVLVVQALNQMFDLAATRIAATTIHPPWIVYAMLIGLAFAAALLAGYQSAGESHDWMRRLGFAVIIAATVYVILEIEFPRLGFVRIDAIDQLLVNARAAMN
jgi:multidrug transporter EmrE-like cation transporter